MLNQIAQWFKEKGGAAHVIAGAWTFLIAAYAMNTQFHDYVKHIESLLPGWMEDLFTLGASLWAFYKTWKTTNPTTAPPSNTPTPVNKTAVLILAMLLLPVVSCKTATTAPPPLAPGAYSQFDQQAFQILSASQATLNSLKQSEPSVPQIKDVLNNAITAYNAAEAVYQTYHAALAAGQQPPAAPVSMALGNLQSSIAAVQAAATGGKQ